MRATSRPGIRLCGCSGVGVNYCVDIDTMQTSGKTFPLEPVVATEVVVLSTNRKFVQSRLKNYLFGT